MSILDSKLSDANHVYFDITHYIGSALLNLILVNIYNFYHKE